MIWVFLTVSYDDSNRAHLDHAAAQLHTDPVIVRCPQRHLPPSVLAFRAPCRFLRRDVVPVVLNVSFPRGLEKLESKERRSQGVHDRLGVRDRARPTRAPVRQISPGEEGRRRSVRAELRALQDLRRPRKRAGAVLRTSRADSDARYWNASPSEVLGSTSFRSVCYVRTEMSKTAQRAL